MTHPDALYDEAVGPTPCCGGCSLTGNQAAESVGHGRMHPTAAHTPPQPATYNRFVARVVARIVAGGRIAA